jgi:DNA modification methylase
VEAGETVPCTVLDPFMGSGTVALVARRLGRKSIGIELNPEYAELCARRLQQQSLFACVVDESAGMKDTVG